MNASSQDFCRRAVAYLKVTVSDDGTPAVTFDKADSPVLRDIGNGLLVAYLVDEGDSFSYVQYRHIQEASLTEDELHDIASINLASFSQENAKVHAYGNVYAVVAGGDFEASMILCEDFWKVWYADLAPNGFVACFPTRDILAFGDSEGAETVSELLAMCARVGDDADHRLTQQLYRRVDAKWVPLTFN